MFRRTEVPSKVQSIVVEQLGVEKSKAQPEASLVDDLGADSLDLVELVKALEAAFDIDIPQKDAAKFIRIKDYTAYVVAQLESARRLG
jgi:acyl carrier protein